MLITSGLQRIYTTVRVDCMVKRTYNRLRKILQEGIGNYDSKKEKTV